MEWGVRLADVLGILPGVAAMAITLLRLLPSRKISRRATTIVIVALGLTAIASSIAYQVIISQERRESENREHDRDKLISEVKGQMGALLQLIPGLATGEPRVVAEAQGKLADVQARLSALEAKRSARHLTEEQKHLLLSGSPVFHGTCELTLNFTHTSETEAYAREIGEALHEAGWPLVYSAFLNFGSRLTDTTHKLAIIANPGDHSPDRLELVFRKAGIEVLRHPSLDREPCHVELQVDDTQ